jgi:aspartyl-tRNA(Asn)/glutamyl-tRNA(Gln) amidotransferase subunit B
MAVATRYEAVIGLEVHAQILTESKMFCSCSTDYLNAPPNSNTCPVCLGLPGSLPVINKRGVEKTVLTALALNCEIPEFTKFDRKNYFYPDLPKGYQISQYDLPLSRNGYLEFDLKGERKRCGITRVHLEEDTGKLLHEGAIHESQSSLVDLNRAGVPLMEIVSEPDLRSADEAREYVVRLRSILQYIGVNHGDMESGQLRCDANVSLRPEGTVEYGTKVEIKNMNSFRSIHRAIEFEIGRQTQVLESGGALKQETRGWNDAQGITVSQRSKEYAHDYRYFPEPDLPPLSVSREWVGQIKAMLPELPESRKARFVERLGLSEYDASVLTSNKFVADYFEEVVKQDAPAKAAANWTVGDLARVRPTDAWETAGPPISASALARLIGLIESGKISGKMAKDMLPELVETGKDPSAVVSERGLAQVSGDDQLRAWVDQVVEANAKSAADFKAGKQQALMFLVGQVMKLSRGQANPARVNELLRERLA